MESRRKVLRLCGEKLAGGSSVCMNRKVDTTRDSDCTKFTEKARTDLESIDGIDWLELFGYYWHIGKLLSNCIQVRMN